MGGVIPSQRNQQKTVIFYLKMAAARKYTEK